MSEECNETLLDYTQTLRKRLIEKFLLIFFPENGENKNYDIKEVKAFAELLRDMDVQELAKLRLALDKNTSKDKEAVYDLVIGILNQLSPNQLRSNTPIIVNKTGLDEDDGVRDYIPGEMDIGVMNEDIETFYQKNQ